jgi:hypothetical protein
MYVCMYVLVQTAMVYLYVVCVCVYVHECVCAAEDDYRACMCGVCAYV